MKQGFAFLQFMTKDSAMEAIENENKTLLLDKVIAVRTAVKKGSGEGETQQVASQAPVKLHARPAAPEIGPIKKPYKPPFEPMPDIFNHTEKSNHIEIMALSRDYTEYAEKIERCLKDRNLRVDLLYPNQNCTMPELLEVIKKRGTLFALEVDFVNVRDQTVTVYMLYSDKIKWQKNMPVTEAITKVHEDSENYIQRPLTDMEPFKKTPNLLLPTAGPQSSNPVSSDVSLDLMLEQLSKLIKEQQLNTSKMDEFIEACRKMRQALAVLENPNAPEPEPEPAVIDPAEKRIKDILNSENYLDKLMGKREPFKMTKERLALLQDPKIERAIDSLLHPDVFQTLNLDFIKNY